MTSIGPRALADMILGLAQLPVPAPVILKTQSPVQFTAFPIHILFQLDRAKAIMDGKPKIPFTGAAGYSEHGTPDAWDTAMGEIYGYRWWYLVLPPMAVGYTEPVPVGDNAFMSAHWAKKPGILYGANNCPWSDGRMEARCTVNDVHEPPEIRGHGCGCGFWAYFNRTLPLRSVLGNMSGQVPRLFNTGQAAVPVFGVVKGTGRVIIGEKGFRSQYAQIMGLCLPQEAWLQLSWWITHGYAERADFWGNFGDNSSAPSLTTSEPCSPEEHATRLSEIENILTEIYPSAKVFTSHELLTKYYPPDANYA